MPWSGVGPLIGAPKLTDVGVVTTAELAGEESASWSVRPPFWLSSMVVDSCVAAGAAGVSRSCIRRFMATSPAWKSWLMVTLGSA